MIEHVISMCLETKSFKYKIESQQSSERGIELFLKGKGSVYDPEHCMLRTAETPRVFREN